MVPYASSEYAGSERWKLLAIAAVNSTTTSALPSNELCYVDNKFHYALIKFALQLLTVWLDVELI
jgi:hypothetical protein